MKKAHLFATITKVDMQTGRVTGVMTEEVTDKAGEKMDYATSAPLFRKWSDSVSKATGGKSQGNVRWMHQPIVAGKVVEMMFDDAAKRITVETEPVDAETMRKIDDGFITGLSIGGNYVGKRWDDPDEPGVKRYTVDPVEVSYVDNPCLQTARFIRVAADGTEGEATFKLWEPSNDEVAAKAAELAGEGGVISDEVIAEARETLVKAHAAAAIEGTAVEKTEAAEPVTEEPAEPAGEPAVEEPAAEPVVEPEAPAEAAPAEAEKMELVQVQRWRTPDGQEFEKKAQANKHLEAMKTLASSGSPLAAAIAAAKAAGTTPAETQEEAFDAGAMADEAERLGKALEQLAPAYGEPGEVVVKGLWGVSSLAEALARLVTVCRDAYWEASAERDGSTVPAMLGAGIKSIGEALIAMAQEEVAEVMARMETDGIVMISEVQYVELAAVAEVVKADEALMTKAGARNSKKDQATIQATHDHMISLGAKCAGADKAAEGDEVKKLQAERDGLQQQIDESLPAIKALGDELGALRKQVADLGAQPAPMPQVGPGQRVVSKDGGAGILENVDPKDLLKALVQLMPAADVQKAVFDAALQQPRQVYGQ